MKITRTEYMVNRQDLPEIWVFTREEGIRQIWKTDQFMPYFYVPADEIDKPVNDPGSITPAVAYAAGKTDRLEGLHLDPDWFTATDGTPVRKVYCRIPREVPERREQFSRTWEADVPFGTRYLIDNIDQIEPTTQRMLVLDIETSNKMGKSAVPSAESALEPIICIGVHDSLYNTYRSWLWRPQVSPGVISRLHDGCLHTITYSNTEQEMLLQFIGYIKTETPDILTGWYTQGFDLPYLINRMIRLDLHQYRQLSPMRSVYIREDKGVLEPVIKGISLVDMLSAYRKVVVINEGEEESYTLDYISRKHLGEGKTESGANVDWMWEFRTDQLIDYNLQDVRLVKMLNDKLKMMEFLDELRRIAFCQLEDTLVMTKPADCFILRMYRGRKVFPTKVTRERVSYEGAFVGSWGLGIHENVAVLDLRSLYPSIIVSSNLSPETLRDGSGDGVIEIKPTGSPYEKIYIDQKATGFLPETIQYLFGERQKYKDQQKKEPVESEMWWFNWRRQEGVKRIMNCFTPDTNILTTGGVTNIRDIKVGDEVLNVDPKSRMVCRDRVTHVWEYDYDGDIYNYCDIVSVTPEHRFLVSSSRKFATATELFDVASRRNPRYNIPPLRCRESSEGCPRTDLFSMLPTLCAHGGQIWLRPPDGQADHKLRWKKIPGIEERRSRTKPTRDKWRVGPARRFDENMLKRLYREGWYVYGCIYPRSSLTPVFFDRVTFVKFLGWYISEGSMYQNNTKKYASATRGTSYKVSIAQKKDTDYIDEIKSTIDQMQLRRIDNTCFSSDVVSAYLRNEVGQYSMNKRVPKFIFKEKAANIRAFFTTLYKGDGTRFQLRYTTKSSGLAEDVACLLARLGMNYIRVNKYPKDSCYRVVWSNHSKNISKTYLQKHHYNGKVYCVTTNNGTVFAGRNGHLIITGQSLYGQTAYPGSRLYDPRIASTITFLAREIIQWSKEQLEAIGYKVLYCDTDSLFFEAQSLDAGGIENVRTYINSTYDRFAAGYGLGHHIFQMEFDKLYRKIFFGKARKKYAGHMVWRGSECDILHTMGFETRRSDAARFSKRLLSRVFEMLLKEDCNKNQITYYIKVEMRKIRDGEFDWEDIGIPKGITKDLDEYGRPDGNGGLKGVPANVRGAKFLRDYVGEVVSSKPKMVYISRTNGQARDDVDVLSFDSPAQVPAGVELDAEKMLEKLVKDKVKGIFSALGWKLSEINPNWKTRRKKGEVPKEQLALIEEASNEPNDAPG